eukprot:1838314-Rhodomonas_salina.5
MKRVKQRLRQDRSFFLQTTVRSRLGNNQRTDSDPLSAEFARTLLWRVALSLLRHPRIGFIAGMGRVPCKWERATRGLGEPRCFGVAQSEGNLIWS